MRYWKHFVAFFAFLAIVAGGVFFGTDARKSSAGSNQNITGWAWSSNIGWISFNSNNEGVGSDYGVDLNLATGRLSGWAWSSNIGWISFNAQPDDLFPASPQKPSQLNLTTNLVEGWAQAQAAIENGGVTDGGWDGWIKLDGVRRNGNKLEGYAWGGDIIGWIEFRDVSVNTVSESTLDVSLMADPIYAANPPLNDVDLTAAVSGSATGPITYAFYCNRSDTGTNITSGWAAKFDNITETSKTAADICDYSADGIYTAKIVAERSGLAVEARRTIYVGQSPLAPIGGEIGGQIGGGGAAIIYIIPPSATIDKGGTRQLSAYFDQDGPAGAAPEVDITAFATWSSSDSAKANVSGGFVTAGNSAGSVAINASYNSFSADSTIVITDSSSPRIIISDPYVSLSPGEEIQLPIYFDPDGNGPLAPIDITYSNDVTCSVSDTSIAEVVAGPGCRIRGLRDGVVYITVNYAYNGQEFSATFVGSVGVSTSVTPGCQALGNPKVIWTPPAINKEVEFKVLNVPGGAAFDWTFPGGVRKTEASPKFKFTFPGKATVVLKISSGGNICEIRRTINIGGRTEE